MEQLLQLAKSSKNGAAFTALWNGSLEGYSSPSEADLALCSHLPFGQDGMLPRWTLCSGSRD